MMMATTNKEDAAKLHAPQEVINTREGVVQATYLSERTMRVVDKEVQQTEVVMFPPGRSWIDGDTYRKLKAEKGNGPLFDKFLRGPNSESALETLEIIANERQAAATAQKAGLTR